MSLSWPKGTGKSFVFGNLSKYGWLVSGGKVTRAKLFYDKAKQQNGIIKNHDFVAFDEIQTIIFQEPAEIQAALKSYLESGKTTIDNNEFSSECGLMIMGNIPLNEQRRPINKSYFSSLPQSFRESALLDRFHCFLEGWNLRVSIKASFIEDGRLMWNTFRKSFILFALKMFMVCCLTSLLTVTRMRTRADFNAVKRVSVAYMKLLFPHWTHLSDVNMDEFDMYCFQPAIRRRGIIKEQCHVIDVEFKEAMPNFWLKCKA